MSSPSRVSEGVLIETSTRRCPWVVEFLERPLTAASTPLLRRAADPFLMVYLTDSTELHWGS